MAEAQTPESPVAANLVTSENREAFMLERLRMPPSGETPPPDDDAPAPDDDTTLPPADPGTPAETPPGTDKPAEEEPQRGSFQYRLKQVTDQKKAAMEAAQQALERARAAEETARQLREKYEPPKSDEPTPEPAPASFANLDDYAKALKAWQADTTEKELRRKSVEAERQAAAEKVRQAWVKRLDETKKALPDYEATLTASTVLVSDPVRDAILESDIGPRILYHIAKHPDIAEKLRPLSWASAAREVGKLEAQLASAPAPKEPKAPETPPGPNGTALAAIGGTSKAPPPINPLRGATTPIENLVGADNEFRGTPAQWRALRKAGKIQ